MLLKLLLLIVFSAVLSIWNPLSLEGWSPYPYKTNYPMSGWGFGSFINIPTRFTRNQSYDLRGDPFPIPVNPYLSPWGMSSYGWIPSLYN